MAWVPFLAFLPIALLLLVGCEPEEDFPDEPYIEFEDFIKINNDSTGLIVLSFTDGDGNIGLGPGDTLDPYVGKYYYNFFLYIFSKKDGVLDSVITQFPFHGRIPRLENVAEGESIQGEIEMEIDIYSMELFIPEDTLAFDIYIVDRDLNYSNTVRTPEIILNRFSQ